MIALLQRVKESSIKVDGRIISQIGRGILVFLGVARHDTERDCEYLVAKIPKLRIFDDNEGKMNLSCEQVKGEILVISQFTLLADAKKGNRPSYSLAAKLENALKLYNHFANLLKQTGLNIKTGQFQHHMEISLTNDGPVTLILNSKLQTLNPK